MIGNEIHLCIAIITSNGGSERKVRLVGMEMACFYCRIE